MTDPQTRIKRVIAEQMIDGPCWIRSFQDVKPTMDAMVADGELVLVRPYNGVGRNMVGLSRKGAKRYKLRVQEHFLFEPPAPPKREPVVRRQTKTERIQQEQRKRAEAAEAERARQRDDLAEHVANGNSIRSGADLLGVSYNTIERRWNEIKDGLGPQAV